MIKFIRYFIPVLFVTVFVGYNNCSPVKNPGGNPSPYEKSNDKSIEGGSTTGNPGKSLFSRGGYGLATTLFENKLCDLYNECYPKYSKSSCSRDLQDVKGLENIFVYLADFDHELKFSELKVREYEDSLVGDFELVTRMFPDERTRNFPGAHVCYGLPDPFTEKKLQTLTTYYGKFGEQATFLSHATDGVPPSTSSLVLSQWLEFGKSGHGLSLTSFVSGQQYLTNINTLLVIPGKTYKFSAWILGQDLENSAVPYWATCGNTCTTPQIASLPRSQFYEKSETGWKLKTFEVTIPANLEGQVPRLQIYIKIIGRGTIQVDEVSLIETSQPNFNLINNSSFEDNPYDNWRSNRF